MNDKYSDKLEVKTKNVINELYLKILGRPADEEGFKYWGSLLESGKITKDEMRQEFLNSYEYNAYIKNNPENQSFLETDITTYLIYLTYEQ